MDKIQECFERIRVIPGVNYGQITYEQMEYIITLYQINEEQKQILLNLLDSNDIHLVSEEKFPSKHNMDTEKSEQGEKNIVTEESEESQDADLDEIFQDTDLLDEIREDTIMEIDIEEYIKQFDAEIQKILYDAYGENLAAIPKAVLMMLWEINNTKFQKRILMRLGIVTGTPMTLEEVAKELNITKARVRDLEARVLRKFHYHHHFKRRGKILRDFEDFC